MKYLFLSVLIFVSFNSLGQSTSISDSLQDMFLNEMIISSRNINSLNLSLTEKSDLLYDKIKSFISANPKNLYSPQFISWGKYFDSVKIDALYNLLDSSLQNRVKESIKYQKLRSTLTPGTIFPRLSLSDTLNQVANISDFTGKIVFIDVWASWCSPCREEMPLLIKLYEKYKDKGFVVIAISLDDNRTKWLDAIKKDFQPWPQFCEFKIWRNSLMLNNWGIAGIPYNFLIDKQGKLIDKEIDLHSLEAEIQKLL